MRLWKIFLLVGIVASGFATGFLWKQLRHNQVVPEKHQAPANDVVVAQMAYPPGYDPSLLLPPPDMKGVMLDMPALMIKDHFREVAGLKTSDREPPPFEELSSPILQLGGRSVVPAPDSVPLDLPPIVRLPAPSEEPTGPDGRVPKPRNGLWMFTNNRDILLNFDVTRRGASGIKAVELWCRHDSRWPVVSNIQQAHRSMPGPYVCVDRMEGDKSPFKAHLWSEGNYEFKMVFESGTGVRSSTPQPHDAPDLYVCLDTTKPVAELLPPAAEATGVIRLRWKAEDKNFDETPIRLEYSIEGDTWCPVALNDEWLPNTGEYLWMVPANLPTELHLRVSARDKAGNVGQSKSPSKIAVDLTKPEGRISGYVEGLPEPRIATELPIRFKTIYVPIFGNKAMKTAPYRGLELELTRAVIKEIEVTTPMTIVSDRNRADTELLGTVVNLTENILNRNQPSDVREGEVIVGVELVWRDLRTQQILSNPQRPTAELPPFDPDNPPRPDARPVPIPVRITLTGLYPEEVGRSNASAQTAACKRVAQQILNMMEASQLPPEPESQNELLPMPREQSKVGGLKFSPMSSTGIPKDLQTLFDAAIELHANDLWGSAKLHDVSDGSDLSVIEYNGKLASFKLRAGYGIVGTAIAVVDRGTLHSGEPARWEQLGRSWCEWLRIKATTSIDARNMPVVTEAYSDLLESICEKSTGNNLLFSGRYQISSDPDVEADNEQFESVSITELRRVRLLSAQKEALLCTLVYRNRIRNKDDDELSMMRESAAWQFPFPLPFPEDMSADADLSVRHEDYLNRLHPEALLSRTPVPVDNLDRPIRYMTLKETFRVVLESGARESAFSTEELLPMPREVGLQTITPKIRIPRRNKNARRA